MLNCPIIPNGLAHQNEDRQYRKRGCTGTPKKSHKRAHSRGSSSSRRHYTSKNTINQRKNNECLLPTRHLPPEIEAKFNCTQPAVCIIHKCQLNVDTSLEESNKSSRRSKTSESSEFKRHESPSYQPKPLRRRSKRESPESRYASPLTSNSSNKSNSKSKLLNRNIKEKLRSLSPDKICISERSSSRSSTNSIVDCLKARILNFVLWITEKLLFVTKGFQQEVILDHFDAEAKLNLLSYLQNLGLHVFEVTQDKDGTKVFKIDIGNIPCKELVMNDLMVFIENEKLQMARRMKKQSREMSNSSKDKSIEYSNSSENYGSEEVDAHGCLKLAPHYNFSSMDVIRKRLTNNENVDKLVQMRTNGSRPYKKGYVRLPANLSETSTNSGPLDKLQAEFEKFRNFCRSPLLQDGERSSTFNNFLKLFESKNQMAENSRTVDDKKTKMQVKRSRSEVKTSKETGKIKKLHSPKSLKEDLPAKNTYHQREPKKKLLNAHFVPTTSPENSLEKIAAIFQHKRLVNKEPIEVVKPPFKVYMVKKER